MIARYGPKSNMHFLGATAELEPGLSQEGILLGFERETKRQLYRHFEGPSGVPK